MKAYNFVLNCRCDVDAFITWKNSKHRYLSTVRELHSKRKVKLASFRLVSRMDSAYYNINEPK